MSLSARRPREDTLTSSPSSSSIAEGTEKMAEKDSMQEPPRENKKRGQDVILYFHNIITQVENSKGRKNYSSAVTGQNVSCTKMFQPQCLHNHNHNQKIRTSSTLSWGKNLQTFLTERAKQCASCIW